MGRLRRARSNRSSKILANFLAANNAKIIQKQQTQNGQVYTILFDN